MPLPPHKDDECPFCRIAATYPPAVPPIPTTDETSIDENPEAFLLLSTPHIIAFLDHAPISRGHVLVATRNHRIKLSDTSIEEGQAIGAWLGIMSRAIVKVVGGSEETHSSGHGLGDWNVVQNNGARAAQVVPHVHFHIIPRTSEVPEVKVRSWTIFGRGQREDLDEEDAMFLQSKIRDALRQELDGLRDREGQDIVDSLMQTGSSSLLAKL